MALDHGTRRIGIAFCDPGESLATPYAVWTNEGEATIGKLAALAGDEQAGAVVVGLPRHDDGAESATAPAARALARSLKALLGGRPVVLWGEQLTTVEADRRMAESNVPRARRAGLRDAVAAALVLEDLIGARRGRRIAVDDASGAGEEP